MKNKIRYALRRELKSVRVSTDLKNRILAEAMDDRFQERGHKPSLAPLAAMAALVLVVALTVGVLTNRGGRPERRSQVFSDGSQDWVWVCEDDALYHALSDCGGMENPSCMPLQEARNAGRTACRACIPVSRPTVVPQASAQPEESHTPETNQYREMENVFDEGESEITAQPEASEMPTVAPLESAIEAGLPEEMADPGENVSENATMEDEVDDGEDFFNPDMTLSTSISEGESRDDDLVWVRLNGRYYHSEEHCSGMMGATQMTIAETEEQGLEACPSCYPWTTSDASSNLFWTTESGGYFHVRQDCSEMTNAFAVTAEDALASGRKPCSACMTDGVYATQKGVYYHAAQHCSGMQNADIITLADALAMGKMRCEICMDTISVYATQNGVFYHCVNTCSGMRGAQTISEAEAVARGQVRCPVCMPMMDELQAQEGTLTLRAVQTEGYLMVEAQPACSVNWISATEPIPVDTDSADFKELTAQLENCMTATELEEFSVLLSAGEIRGVQVVRYDVATQQMIQTDSGTGEAAQVRNAMKSIGFDDPSGTMELFDCGSATADTVSLSISAWETDYLVWPDGSSVGTGSLIEMEPESLLSADGDSAVLTFRQKRAEQHGTINATISLHQVEGEARYERADNAELTLITLGNRKFVRVILDEWANAMSDNDERVEVVGFQSNGQKVKATPVNVVTGYGGSAAYMIEDASASQDLEMQFSIDGRFYHFSEKDMPQLK